MSIFKKKKPTPAERIKHVATITAGVKELLKNEVVKIVANNIYLYADLWHNKKTAENWMKNLYMYSSLYLKHKKETPLYFKNIETEELLGFYQDGKPTVLN